MPGGKYRLIGSHSLNRRISPQLNLMINNCEGQQCPPRGINYNFFKKFMCANIPIAMAKRKLIPPNSLINFNGITQILDNIWKINKHAKILKTLTHQQASTIRNLRKKLSKSLKSKQWKNKAISLLEEAFPATIVLAETIIKINNKLNGPKLFTTTYNQYPTDHILNIVDNLEENPDKNPSKSLKINKNIIN